MDGKPIKSLFYIVQTNQIHSLEANRKNEFTDIQKELIAKRIVIFKWYHTLLIILIAIAALVISFFFVRSLPSTLSTSLIFVLLVIPGFVTIAVILTVSLIKRGLRKNVRKVLQKGIASCYGKYCFDFGLEKYVAESGLRILAPLFLVNMVPGAYKFYYSPELNTLLSAEPCDEKLVPSFDPTTESLNNVLKKVFDFNEADMKVNRDGQLSEGQWQKYEKKIRKSERGVVSVVDAIWKNLPEESLVPVTLDITMNFLGPIPNLAYYLVKSKIPTEYYKLYVSNKVFEVSRIKWIAIVEGLTYQVNYLSDTNEILSIENVIPAPATTSTTYRCPKCGSEILPWSQNCPVCKINLVFAREHPELWNQNVNSGL